MRPNKFLRFIFHFCKKWSQIPQSFVQFFLLANDILSCCYPNKHTYVITFFNIWFHLLDIRYGKKCGLFIYVFSLIVELGVCFINVMQKKSDLFFLYFEFSEKRN